MKSDVDKSKDELIKEIEQLRQQAAACDTLESRIEEIESERNHTEEALRLAQLIIDQSPVILFRRLAGDDPKLVYVSRNIARFGYCSYDFLNDKIRFRDILHPEDIDRVGDEIREYVKKDAEEYLQLYRILTKDGEVRWVEDHTSIVRNQSGEKTHHQGIVVDITKRKLAEEELRKSEEKFRRIVETAGEGFILMDEDLHILDVNDAYCRLIGYTREELIGKTPFDFASEAFRHFMLTNKDQILAQEYRELEGVSIAKDGRKIPTLIHGSTLRDDRGAVIGNMAFVTDMTEHKKALALAAEVQKSLLPQEKPPIPGLDIAGRNVSCDEIGGDYFDFIWQGDHGGGQLSIVVGDITGHGVDAALLMTTARAFLRMRTSQPGTLSEIITAMNRHLTQDILESGRFMTLFYMTIDPENETVEWVRAGHDPAIVYDPDQNRFQELKGPGIALGIDETIQYQSNRKSGVSNGQVVAIGTDGIWEARNREGKMFGKDRFKDIIRQNAKAGAGEILESVFDELNQFTFGQRSEDDSTLVVIKVKR